MRVLAVLTIMTSLAMGASERIRINQVGYAVGSPKFAISLDSGTAFLIDSALGGIAKQAPLGRGVSWSKAMDTGRVFDFGSVNTPGTYYVVVGKERSHPVRIAMYPYTELVRGLIKSYWYTRASYAPQAPWAGVYARPMGHPDTEVRIHESAATRTRPKNTLVRSPGGWYDAGDYGKYVVNSGITTWTLLRLYETSRPFFDTLQLNVPAHGAPTSDLLAEVLWNLRWMLTMQDPDDGGVYSKLTTAQHANWVMPDRDRGIRYLIQKSTAATLDMAAVAAYASRLLRGVPSMKPLSDSCLSAALSGWAWARANPDSLYHQDTLNDRYSPTIGTGPYDDVNVADEFQWAASELSITTGSDSFATAIGLSASLTASAWNTLGWENVGTLGRISLLAHRDSLPGTLSALGPALGSGLSKFASTLAKPRSASAYHLPVVNFWWGNAGLEANIGLVLWEAWRNLGDTAYRDASLDALDYVLGRNATGYSFVTGFGSKTPKHPHNRITESDSIAAPIPGLVVGGPSNSAASDDGCDYPSDLEAKQYVDDRCSYSTNENSINQGAAVTYLAGVWAAANASAPLGVSRFHHRAPGSLSLSLRDGSVIASAGGTEIVQLELRTLDGRAVASMAGNKIGLQRIPSGIALVHAKDAQGHVLTAKMPIP